MAMLTNPDLKVVYPSEGIGFGIMAGFIPSKAPNADAAHAFMDYLLRPEIAAQYFEWLGYYSTNKAADSHINEEYREFLTLPSDFTGETEMIKDWVLRLKKLIQRFGQSLKPRQDKIRF